MNKLEYAQLVNQIKKKGLKPKRNPRICILKSIYRKKEHTTVPMTAQEAEDKRLFLERCGHHSFSINYTLPVSEVESI